ncbi:ABC transporter ATP-binding protein [Butyrivibrio sp. INlla16]|uniref:ABC transporter ATP-binding protein n=1 Tax=Butyrivibrio sp. INlla16 TaxID=1520807 RepID=UPI00088D7139|nr:ABC transporter ATP-binding protein [Butyrivibrio sp. INlla16]SDB69284.1 ABC-2 type transport system ATP-binding protein [Butyrivibrio sp. INlla16]
MKNITIEIKNVNLAVKNKRILSDVNLSINGGKIYGLIGKNGSGKSVFLKSIAGFSRPESGSLVINGKEAYKDFTFYNKIGFIINQPGFIENKSGFQNMSYLAALRGKTSKEHIKMLMKKLSLDPDSPKKVSEYSLGMRQKLGIVQAIMEDPEIILLDEPMNALDEESVDIVRELLKNLRDEGKIIIITSHNHEDIEFLCDDVYCIKNGVIDQNGTDRFFWKRNEGIQCRA